MGAQNSAGDVEEIHVGKYEFLLDFSNTRIWTRVVGNGGDVGDGCLHVTDPSRVCVMQDDLLRRVRAELAQGHGLRARVQILGSRVRVPLTVYPLSVAGCRALSATSGGVLFEVA